METTTEVTDFTPIRISELSDGDLNILFSIAAEAGDTELEHEVADELRFRGFMVRGE